jgi:hypothetical protein
MVHTCPLCGLRFHFATELELHAREDHIHVQVDEHEEVIIGYKHSGRPTLGPVYLPL